MLNVVAVVLGIVFLSTGAALVFPPAGLIVAGVALAGAGLFMDDGS